MSTVTADHIIGMLAERHKDDVWVPECKNGSTHSSSDLLRLDGWAMKRSWAHFATIGYEVKVNRSDFERDQKWVRYLDYCHAFHFVCPNGLIKSTDLPKGIGLIWVSATGNKLLQKVKPEKREPDPEKLLDLMTYVLMCRTRVVGDMWEANAAEPVDRDKAYREWVEQATRRKDLASFVNSHVRERFSKQATELLELQADVHVANELKKFLADAGVPWPAHHWQSWEARQEINRRLGIVPSDVTDGLRGVRSTIDRWLERFGKAEAAE